MNEKLKDSPKALMTTSFRDRESAERAFDLTMARGYKPEEIHVFMTDDTRKKLFVKENPKTDLGNKALQGAGVGGALGGVVGATLVGLAAAAATVTVPGVGLVLAGPLAGALAGGAAGATAGGLLGVLVGAGIPETHARGYETELKSGGIVLGVMPRHDEDARYFKSEWHGQHVSK
jgi:hypothetical protein